MSRDLVDFLLGEHAVLYAQFDQVDTASAGHDLATLHAQAGMIAAALVSHAHIEEELLFRALESVTDASAPLSIMRDEHARIEDALARAQKAHAAPEALDHLRDAVSLSRDHFHKEEVVLLPLARRALGPQRLAAAVEAWAKRRGVRVYD
jgi:iron-sulfur cluster repair protein YtfE (RIC family)